MAQWLQAQLNVAQNLLESVDRTISKTVGVGMNAEAGDDPETAAQGLPFPDHQAPSDTRHSPVQHANPKPPAAHPSDTQPHATTFTIRQRGPFDSPSAHTPPPLATQPNPAPTATPLSSTSTGPPPQFSSQPAATEGSRPGPQLSTSSRTPAQPMSSAHSAIPFSYSAAPAPQAPFEPTATPPAPPAPAVPAASNVTRVEDAAPAAVAAGSPATGAKAARASATEVATGPVPAARGFGERVPQAPVQAQAPVEQAAVPTAQTAGGNGNGSSAAAAAGSSSSGSHNNGGSGGLSAGALKLVEQLRKRLEVAQAENEQLEEMLKREEKRAATEAAAAQKLAEELSNLQDTRAQTEAALQSALAAQQLTSRDLSNRLDLSSRQVLKLEAEVAGLQDTARLVAESRSGLEGGMLEALKSQLEAAEQRLVVESRAHQATKASAMARETELEGQLSSGARALADMQRALDESGVKGRDLEDQVALLQSECQQLEQQQQQRSADASGPRGGDGAVDGVLLDALRADLSAQQRACQASDAARQTAEAQLKQLRQEAQTLRAELEEHAARGDVSQLEARLREVTDMLYLKQNQLERLSADKAAQQLRLERELHQARLEVSALRQQEGQIGGGGSRMDARGSLGDEVIPMDALGAPYQRLAQNGRVGTAVKAAANFLDSTASSAVFFLRQYPLARLLIFAYLLFLHLYVYYLMARLQGIAVKLESMTDLAAITGLNSSTSVLGGRLQDHK